MDLPADVSVDAVLGFSAVVMTPIIAGIVQAFVRSGLPVRHASMLALVLGVGLSISVAASNGGVLIVALVQGAVVGMGAFGAFAVFSNSVNTNGDANE